MKESDDLSVLSIASEVDSKSTRTGWLEKHAELIKKLEAEYQFTPILIKALQMNVILDLLLEV